MKSGNAKVDATLVANVPPAPKPGGIFGYRLRDVWEGLRQLGSRPPHRLRLCESLALGDRRMVAVIEYEGFRFLVGGTSSSLTLLDRLDPARTAGTPEIEHEAVPFGAGKEPR